MESGQVARPRTTIPFEILGINWTDIKFAYYFYLGFRIAVNFSLVSISLCLSHLPIYHHSHILRSGLPGSFQLLGKATKGTPDEVEIVRDTR
jgi:hypothetical protein